MAREKTGKKVSDKVEIKEKVEVKHDQLHLFAAFREIWQAQVP